METKAQTNKLYNPKVYRVIYGLFLIMTISYLLRNNLEQAVINMGIALLFDPFDQSIKWQDRKMLHKVWLLTHLALTLIGAAYLLIR
ncbi:MAG: hypothetical protein IPH88_18190 [Bacteroidales bacterium]|nr:hypothetical protein [Bacteroidales bacterium]